MNPPQANPEMAHQLARLLRHEVGDLLQSVYSTTAVLLERLAEPFAQERRLLADLKSRAELCKLELDAAVTLVSPAEAALSPVELAPLVRSAMARARNRYPAMPVRFDGEPDPVVRADGPALTAALTLLLLACCQAARQQVQVQLRREGAHLLCAVCRDGFPVPAEQLAWLDRPFATTHNAAFGLALALTRRAVEPCGGSVAVVNLDGGGICVRLQFPVTDA
jgi:signal transduction histidine kinase